MVVIFMRVAPEGSAQAPSKLGRKLCWRRNTFRPADEPAEPRLTGPAASRTWGPLLSHCRAGFSTWLGGSLTLRRPRVSFVPTIGDPRKRPAASRLAGAEGATAPEPLRQKD